jgi:hypothetical protein
MQPSLPTNLSIEELRFQNHSLERVVEEQRERIEALERADKPVRRGLWERVFGSVAVLVLVVGMAQPLLAGFQTGNDWLDTPEAYKTGYVTGAFDAFDTATQWGVGDFGWMEECIVVGDASWTYDQVKAVLEKLYADNPQTRHLTTSSVLNNALAAVCTNAGE